MFSQLSVRPLKWIGVQHAIEVGLQRRLRRDLQIEQLIICLVQPAPAGTPQYNSKAIEELDYAACSAAVAG